MEPARAGGADPTRGASGAIGRGKALDQPGYNRVVVRRPRTDWRHRSYGVKSLCARGRFCVRGTIRRLAGALTPSPYSR